MVIIIAHVAGVKSEGIRGTFWTTPERLATSSRGIFRQGEQKLLDRVVVFFFEQKPCPDNAFIEPEWLLGDERRQYLSSLFTLLSRVL